MGDKYFNVNFKMLSQNDYNLVIFRPYISNSDSVEKILSRFTEKKFEIFRKKFVGKDIRFWDYFYPSDSEWLRNIGTRVLIDNEEAKIKTKDIVGTNKPIRIGHIVKNLLCRDMAAGSALSVIIVGQNAATIVKEMFGAPIPIKALPGTIRHDFGNNDSNPLAFSEQRTPYNVGHCSNKNETRNGVCAIRFETGLIYPELFF